MSYWKGLYAK